MCSGRGSARHDMNETGPVSAACGGVIRGARGPVRLSVVVGAAVVEKGIGRSEGVGDGAPDDRQERRPIRTPGRRDRPPSSRRGDRAPLLAVAGAQDTQILPANVPAMATAMPRAGRRVETPVFPDEGHLLLTPANVRRFWVQAFATVQAGCTTRR